MKNHKRTSYRLRLIMGRWYVIWYGGRGDIELGSNDYGDNASANAAAKRSGLHDLDTGPIA